MSNNYLRLIGIIIILIAIIAAGYFTFIYFVKNIVPSFSSYGLIIIAMIAGVSMFFNPCSFTLLPAFLTFFATKSELKGENKLGKFLLYGLFASLGIITFSIILGSLIGLLGVGFGKSFALTGDAPNLSVRIFRGVIGGLLAIFGLMHFRGVSFKTGALNKLSQGIMSPGNKGPLMGMYLYGFGYNALGIGCGGPIMAGLLVFSLSLGGFSSALLAFIIFSLTMVVLMLLISILVGLSKDTLINKMKTSSGKIKKFTGIIMLLVGLFLLLSAIFTKIFVGILFPGG
ncbi:MAG: hypothetical protein IIA87_00840 [Nanoarchaeota archaeon]|nr:hypothetical protein [Nanoarchaeota archaeon]